MTTTTTTAPARPTEPAPTLTTTIWNQLRMNLQTYTLIAALVLIWLYFSYRTDGTYLAPRNFSNLFRQMTITAFLSVGMVLVIVTGNIDLSVGKLAGFVSVVVAYYQANYLTKHFDQDWVVMLLSILIGIGVGLVYGIIQGYIIAYLNVTAFIVTLGSMWLLDGAILLRTAGRTIQANQPLFSEIGQGYQSDNFGWILAGVAVVFLFYTMFRGRQKKRSYNFDLPPLPMDLAKVTGLSALILIYIYRVNNYKGVPNPVLLLAIVVLIMIYISNNTRFGRYAYAIGGNREATKLSGVSIQRNIFLVFVLMGFLCGISGVTMASYVGYGTISAGDGYELDAIAACILGGTSTLGGVGTVFGAIVGAVIMVSLTNGLQMINTPAAYQYILKGIVLVVAVYADVRLSKNR
ncbi:MAG: sugar ABC transporter permease [Anaerolineae bacterium]|nr:sugar ABC transporter permease [Anaerolineae bacterium]